MTTKDARYATTTSSVSLLISEYRYGHGKNYGQEGKDQISLIARQRWPAGITISTGRANSHSEWKLRQDTCRVADVDWDDECDKSCPNAKVSPYPIILPLLRGRERLHEESPQERSESPWLRRGRHNQLDI